MSQQWETRKTLLQRAQDPNDQNAWKEFVVYYQPFIKMVLQKMNMHSSDLDDLVQEMLIKIWRNIAHYDTSGNQAKFRTWLSHIIRRRAIDFIRSDTRYKKRIEQAINDNITENEDMFEPELEELIQKEWEYYITQCALNNIKKLFSGVAIQAFELSLEGKKADEISAALNITPGSVRTLKNRVKIRFVSEIEQLRNNLEFRS